MSLQTSWLILRANINSQSGIWDGLAIGTSHAISLQMTSNFTVLALHTRTQGELGSGIRQDPVLVVFLSAEALSGFCPCL